MEAAQTGKIIITGGHMTPAFAVQTELRKHGFEKFVWIGHKYNQTSATDVSPEYKTVTAMNDTQFIDLPAGKLVRSWKQSPAELWLAFINLLKIPYGFLQAGWIVAKHRPKYIVSFGGYLAVPVVFWGKILGIRTVSHEQTVTTGTANRVLAKLADKIFISWPESAKFYPPSRTILTGNPVRKDIFEVKSKNINFYNDLPIIYVTGGNQGSVGVNKVLLDSLPELLQFCNVVHQTGSAEDTIKLLKELKLTPELSDNYINKPFFFANEIGEIYNKAYLVVARSGANTVTEMIALAKPSIFIPIPWVTQNEQMRNAEFAQQLGIASILPEADLNTQSLISCIKTSLENLRNGYVSPDISLVQAKQNCAQALPKDAAHTIVREMLKL